MNEPTSIVGKQAQVLFYIDQSLATQVAASKAVDKKFSDVFVITCDGAEADDRTGTMAEPAFPLAGTKTPPAGGKYYVVVAVMK